MIRDMDETLRERLAEPVEDRQFVLRGHTYTIRASIRPEAMVIWNGIDDTSPGAEDDVRRFMSEVLVEDDLAHWDAARQLVGDDALTSADMVAILSLLVTRAVGRPPTRPDSSSASSDSPESGTESKAASSLRVAGQVG